MTPAEELDRVRAGAGGATPPADSDRLLFACPGGAGSVLERVREVLLAVLSADPAAWPAPEAWATLLPAWFVAACVDDVQVRDCVIDRWSLRAWTFWFRPDRRRWRWWDAQPEGERLEVVLLVESRPYLRGALEWLLSASGARPT